MYTLGFESSCDETAVGVIQEESKILANTIYSQAELHSKYGGVVPEIASRNHLKKISPLLEKSLEDAGIDLSQVDLVTATYGPGLVGPLLVGLSLGKSIAYGLDVPFLGVNHLEGHVFAHYLQQEVEVPFLALLVSGGHTNLIHVQDWGEYRNLGGTRDDAAGEAFDKVGHMTGLGYPAGPKIDRLSKEGNRAAIEFPRPMIDTGLDFSFAGLKTAVSLMLKGEGKPPLSDLLASFQEAVVETLVVKTMRAAKQTECDHVVAIGGVAANSRLREKLSEAAENSGRQAFFPPLGLCTDNGAMIALCGRYRHAVFGERSDSSLGPDPSLKLGS
ncbi:MAG: tRNA (adenosine(37)-N6)-threonylcarbamoyltransferase complex transferase subunit TsaD [Candidatus Acetothermia bacterium]